MNLGKTLFIVNPAARHGETRKLVPLLERTREGMTEAQIKISAGPRHAFDLARTAQGFSSIVAVGGDGTAHEVLNGVMEHESASRPAFGVVPTGSGNDLAHTLGMSDDLTTAIGQLASGGRVKMDVGTCNGMWFGGSVSMGLDARVTVKAVELKTTTGLSGLSLYLKSLMYVLRNQYHSHLITVQFDDEEPFETDALIVAVTNGPTYGGGFRITPDSVYDDGLLDVCRIDSIPKAEAFMRLPFVIVGKHTKMRPVHMRRAKRVTVVSEEQLEGQVDGEVMLSSAYDIGILPQALTAIVPAERAQ
jgi:YegS/Rv2252/BmrU family lipid kinase